MTESVRFVKIRTCKKCKIWLLPGTKGDLCPKCTKEVTAKLLKSFEEEREK